MTWGYVRTCHYRYDCYHCRYLPLMPPPTGAIYLGRCCGRCPADYTAFAAGYRCHCLLRCVVCRACRVYRGGRCLPACTRCYPTYMMFVAALLNIPATGAVVPSCCCPTVQGLCLPCDCLPLLLHFTRTPQVRCLYAATTFCYLLLVVLPLR